MGGGGRVLYGDQAIQGESRKSRWNRVGGGGRVLYGDQAFQGESDASLGGTGWVGVGGCCTAIRSYRANQTQV